MARERNTAKLENNIPIEDEESKPYQDHGTAWLSVIGTCFCAFLNFEKQ